VQVRIAPVAITSTPSRVGFCPAIKGDVRNERERNTGMRTWRNRDADINFSPDLLERLSVFTYQTQPEIISIYCRLSKVHKTAVAEV
jgi:hypothetical protein